MCTSLKRNKSLLKCYGCDKMYFKIKLIILYYYKMYLSVSWNYLKVHLSGLLFYILFSCIIVLNNIIIVIRIVLWL